MSDIFITPQKGLIQNLKTNFMGWMIFTLAILGWHIGLYGMFKKAGITPWKALIPFYNTWCIVEKCNLKKIWFWLQLIPIAGQFITIWLTIIFVMHFGKLSLISHTLCVLVPFAYFPYLGYSSQTSFPPHLRCVGVVCRRWRSRYLVAVCSDAAGIERRANACRRRRRDNIASRLRFPKPACTMGEETRSGIDPTRRLDESDRPALGRWQAGTRGRWRRQRHPPAHRAGKAG